MKTSTTKFILITSFLILAGKLALSGLTIAGMTFPEFPASEFGIGLAAASALYVGRRHQSIKDE